MRIDIYKSVTNGNKYLSVPENTDVKSLKLPADAESDFRKPSLFKASVDIAPDDKRIALDSAGIIQQINSNDFAIHSAKIEMTGNI